MRDCSNKAPLAPAKGALSVAAEEGFEPSHTESESAVLPLHNSAIFACFSLTQKVLYHRKTALSIVF